MAGSRLRLVPIVLIGMALAGCAAGGDVTRPVPTAFLAAPQPAHRLVVMLPGRGDDLQGLERHGIARTIQQVWPDADVVLAGLTMPFYLQGRAAQRLHDEVIAPATARRYREIWLGGISLGGMGALLYDRLYPHQVTGLLLMSPYLGDQAIQDQVRKAGGVSAWQPGPTQGVGSKTWQRELWRSIKAWPDDPSRARTVWVAYGDAERFRPAIELMAQALPPGHALMLPGHHDWDLWTPAASALLRRAATPASGTQSAGALSPAGSDPAPSSPGRSGR